MKVGIIGHTGKLGKPLVQILNKHPYAEIVYTESRKEGSTGSLSDAEIVFLALPYGKSGNYLPKLNGKKLIDLSIDHRLDDGWVYGLPELNKSKIKAAQKVANPGCYATSIILALAPIKEKISNVHIASTSGISGAGLEVQEEDNFKIYKEGNAHLQIAEIEKALGLENALFVPQRIDTAYRGIVSTIFCNHEEFGNLIKEYNQFYSKSHFIRIADEIETKNVNGTNFCDIKPRAYNNKIIIISALDNLIKGGAGQAVQNFNMMHGLDETTGLL
ncbi:N-acetyl-gamma-glutamyl-phosphate reductase [Candidatus Woesearchaeota archaeon]|nr:N-acetyl-gamma-glutamyl-phosphate reductase [Candidatus Woesearchaeota archaeon]